MGKLRTVDELEASLTEDLKWRKQELTQWRSVTGRVRPHELPAILRGGLAILYGHWEGYVKASATAYLTHIALKGLKLDDLRPELAAVALRGRLGAAEVSKKAADHTDLVVMIRDNGGRAANLPYDRATIRTYSNLTFERFEDIMHSIGCDASRHEIYRTLIDSRLLKNRNEIAHGREQYVDLTDWDEIRSRILDILEDVRNQISNAAATAAYKRT